MEEELAPLVKYISSFCLLIVWFFCLSLLVVNFRYIDRLNHTIDTMWHEIEQVKETNIKLYQFVEEHKNDVN
jgi:hypothetical protein